MDLKNVVSWDSTIHRSGQGNPPQLEYLKN